MKRICLAVCLIVLMAVPAFAADMVIETVDRGSIHGPGSYVAVDEEGTLHLAFFAEDRHSLKYAVYGEDGWEVQTVYETSQNMFADISISLALDQYNNPHIACVLMSGSDSKRALDISGPENLFYACYDGTEWNTEILGETHDFKSFVSLALDSQGGPHIGYSYFGNVEYASKQAEGWNIETVVSGDSIGTCYLAIDNYDTPHVSFKDFDYDMGNPLYYTFSDGDSWAEPVSIDSTGNSNHPITAENGIPMISYQDSNYNLKFATLSGDQWVSSVIDSSDNVGEYSSIKTDQYGGIHISYYERYADNLKYANFDGSRWNTEYVDMGGNVRTVPSSLAVKPSGDPVISYVSFSPDSDLKCAFKVDGNWNIEVIPPEGPSTGYYHTIALDSAEDPHMVYSSSDGTVYYARYEGSDWEKDVVVSFDVMVGAMGNSLEGAGLGGPVIVQAGFGLDEKDIAHVVFPDYGSGYLKYGTWSGDEWSFERICPEDPIGFGRSSFVFELESSGMPHLFSKSYPDFVDDGYVLQHVKKENGVWSKATVEESDYDFRAISLAIDEKEKPAGCYYQYDSRLGQGMLKYAAEDNGSWDIQTVISSDVDMGIIETDLHLDTEGNPHIAFVRYPEGLVPNSLSKSPISYTYELWYATKSGGTWGVQLLDTLGSYREGNVSINNDLDNNPHITYGSGSTTVLSPESTVDEQAPSESVELKYAYSDGTDWFIKTLDSGVMPEFGSFSSLIHDSSNNPHVAYFTGTGLNYSSSGEDIQNGNGGCSITSFFPSMGMLLLPLGLLILKK